MGKVYNAIMGLVVGDALGVPVEFEERDTFKVEDMIGYGTYNQPPGTWSDDSSMTLATLESLWRKEKIDPADMMDNFSDWYNSAEFTPRGEVFDAGSTTVKAILRYSLGVDPLKCGGKEEKDNGNGALMRILPIVFYKATYAEVRDVCDLTHAHIVSEYACHVYVQVAKMILMGWSKKDCVQNGISVMWVLSEKFSVLSRYGRLAKIEHWNRDDVNSSGYVVDTLEAALWCFLKTDSYKDCVLTAVNLGGDTDTIAAVAGGLAGMYYGIGGEQGIPEKWIKKIAKKDWIADLCGRVERDLGIES